MLQYFAESRWYTIVGATAFYAVTSYWLLYAANENDLIAIVYNTDAADLSIQGEVIA